MVIEFGEVRLPIRLPAFFPMSACPLDSLIPVKKSYPYAGSLMTLMFCITLLSTVVIDGTVDFVPIVLPELNSRLIPVKDENPVCWNFNPPHRDACPPIKLFSMTGVADPLIYIADCGLSDGTG